MTAWATAPATISWSRPRGASRRCCGRPISRPGSLPIDCLKIDRSFIARLHNGASETAVLRSIVRLGKSLGKTVLAEGIETEPQLQQLCEMGCLLGQGYLLARPLPAHDVSRLLCSPALPAIVIPPDLRLSHSSALLH